MQRLSIALGILLSGWIQGAELRIDFDASQSGQPPPGFRSTVSGTGEPGQWQIVMDQPPALLPPISPQAPAPRRPVIAQLARDKTDEHFPLLIYEKEQFDDFTLSMWIKLVAGEVEQMAGLAFRIKDENNYYYVRASALGDSFIFYKVLDGQRGLPYGNKVEIATGVWHKLTVQCQGNRITTLFNDKEVIPAITDSSLTGGKIGLWTKSDSVCHFSDIRIQYQPKEVFAQQMVRDVLELYPRLEGLKVYARIPDGEEIRMIASDDPSEVGRSAGKTELDVMERGVVYHGASKGTVTVAMPLHDHNGDTMAAISVVMKRFPGQTEKNAISRALPVVKALEARVLRPEELHK